MGFSFASRGVIPPRAIILLLLILDLVQFIVFAFFFYTGLSPSSERPQLPSWEDIAIIFFDGSLSKPTEPSASSIKSQLRVSEFASLSRRCPEMFKEGEAMCIVCLGSLEGRDEIRELGNCCHAFHKECIDRWVDIERRTCPMCRSQLLPSESRGGIWNILRVFGVRVC